VLIERGDVQYVITANRPPPPGSRKPWPSAGLVIRSTASSWRTRNCVDDGWRLRMPPHDCVSV